MAFVNPAAVVTVGAVDSHHLLGLYRLLRYVLHPPLTNDRLAILPDHRVRLTLKRPRSDGAGRGAAAWGRAGPAGATYALDMDALALLARLASAVPPPKQHLTRYSGVLAPAGHWRSLIIPAAPAPSSPSSGVERRSLGSARFRSHRARSPGWVKANKIGPLD